MTDSEQINLGSELEQWKIRVLRLKAMLELKTDCTLNKREQVWLQSWSAVASSPSCKNHRTAQSWARESLREYDRLFGDREDD